MDLNGYSRTGSHEGDRIFTTFNLKVCREFCKMLCLALSALFAVLFELRSLIDDFSVETLMLISIVLHVLLYCLRCCSAAIFLAECSHFYYFKVAAIERPPSCLFSIDYNGNNRMGVPMLIA